MLKEHCHINENVGDDVFVGLRCTATDYNVFFPLGFPELSEDDNETRKDILLLLSTLKKNTDKKKSEIVNSLPNQYENTATPIQAYLYVIKDFLYRGYYKELEVIYSSSKKGKINWGRTIKHIKPIVQDTDIFYLDFITKKTVVNENELLTLIHQYCVYIAFECLGWLFVSFKLPKPQVVFNKNLFVSVLKKKLANTFNDQNKNLFRSLLAIVEERSEENDSYEFMIGTTAFHSVWENMVDRVYGIANKNEYFPYTVWNFDSTDERTRDDYGVNTDADKKSSSLIPDSIMIPDGQDKVYVLDSKYYKYGNWPQLWNLPKSADINKQITYGEYISEAMLDGADVVYNAFVMPFDASREDWQKKKQESKFKDEPAHLHWIGESKSSWKKNSKRYERIQGVLLDVKYLMLLDVTEDQNEILQLAKLIEDQCNERLEKDKK